MPVLTKKPPQQVGHSQPTCEELVQALAAHPAVLTAMRHEGLLK